MGSETGQLEKYMPQKIDSLLRKIELLAKLDCQLRLQAHSVSALSLSLSFHLYNYLC